METYLQTMLLVLGMMAGVVGVSVALVQLMHWSEAKRADLMRKVMIQSFNEGYHAGKSEVK